MSADTSEVDNMKKGTKRLPVWFKILAYANDDLLAENDPVAEKTVATMIGGSHFMENGGFTLCEVLAIQDGMEVSGMGMHFPEIGETIQLPTILHFNPKLRKFSPVC